MKYYIFDFFKKLSIQDKINFKIEYGSLCNQGLPFFVYLFKSQSVINKYRNKTKYNSF